MSDTDAELADAAADLAEKLEALREELRAPPRGPLGLPRPPSPNELLTLTERYTIPALIATFETSIRLLELLAAAIRLARGAPVDADAAARLEASDFAVASGRAGVDRLAAASRTTLEGLDEALADLQSAAGEGAPDNPEAERLLREARELRAEVDARLAEATPDADAPAREEDDSTDIEVRDESDADTGSAATGEAKVDDSDDDEADDDIDVDAELRSIKDEVSSAGPDEKTENDA